MRFKLIALDVDGTLLNDHHQITRQTRQTIRQAHEAGARIVLCTGRGPASTLPILRELGLEGTMITHNGAATIASDGTTLLHQYSFALEEIVPLVEYARREGVHFDVCTPFEMYIEQIEEHEKQMYETFFIQPNLVADVTNLGMPLVKLTLFGEREVLDRVEKDWHEQKLYGDLRMIRSGEVFIDVMSPKANKGNALRDLAASWHIAAEHVVAIGNYYNDVEMLNFAGLGIAVGNSPDGVKQAADVVTATNNEDGVHQALLNYVL